MSDVARREDRAAFQAVTGGTASLDWVVRCIGCLPELVLPHRCRRVVDGYRGGFCRCSTCR